MTALVTVTYRIEGTELVCDVTTWTDDPGPVAAAAVANGARWIHIEPDPQPEVA